MDVLSYQTVVYYDAGIGIGTGYRDPIRLKKQISVTGVREVEFSAEETNTLTAGMPVFIRVRYYKAKTSNDDKAVLISESTSNVQAVMQ